MGKSSAKRSMRAQARAQGYGEIKCKKVNARTGLWENQVQKGQCAHRRAHRVMGKSSAKRSMRAQARAQGYGEIKCKKVNARTEARTDARTQGYGEIKCKKINVRTQARAQGYGEIKCKKVNARTGARTDARTGLWGNQVQKGQCAHRRAHRNCMIYCPCLLLVAPSNH